MLRVRIARSYWRWIFRHSTKTIFHNVTIGVLWPTAQDLVALERVKEALNLLAQYAPIALQRLAGFVDGILIFPGGPAGRHMPRARLIVLRYDDMAKWAAPDPPEIASTLVHEAMHAYLHARGIPYDSSTQYRIEEICYRAELAFARRLPNPGTLITDAEYMLSVPRDYLSAEARLYHYGEYLRELGLPRVLVSALVGLSRFRSRRVPQN